jgi:serine/threonine-protein kinase
MKVGQVVDKRYKLVAELGAGAFGKVFEAEHILVGRRYALKCLHPSMTHDTKVISRFLREAHAAARIGSDHIVEVIDASEGDPEGSPPYLVMEYLEGSSLDKLVADGPLAPSRAVRLIRHACEAMQAAHDREVIHRDLKPANLWVTRKDGEEWLKVLDFGVACFRSLGVLTSEGKNPGTPLYTAPELFNSGSKADERSDIWP